MENKIKKIILYIIVVLLILPLIEGVNYYSKLNLYQGLFWICYTALPIIIIGILLRKPTLILTQLFIIMIPDILWIIDFIGMIFTGNSLFGISKYFFEPSSLFRKLSTFQHFYTVPLSILALGIIKTNKIKIKILLISFCELMGFFILGFILPPRGINCLPNGMSCTSLHITDAIPYPLFWIIVEFSFATISYLIICSLPFIKKRIK